MSQVSPRNQFKVAGRRTRLLPDACLISKQVNLPHSPGARYSVWHCYHASLPAKRKQKAEKGRGKSHTLGVARWGV